MQEKLHLRLVATAWAALVLSTSAARGQNDYPNAERGVTVDTYHGVEVADPYRWMEDMRSDESQRWLEAQEALLERHLAGSRARVDELRARILEITSFERRTAPRHRGSATFHTEIPATGSNVRLFVSRDGGEQQLLFDAAQRLESSFRFNGYAPSEDGAIVVLRVTRAGAPFQQLRAIDGDSGEWLDDLVHDSWGAPAWHHDGSGYFYSRFPARISDDSTEALGNPSVWFHRLGRPQSEDRLVYERDTEESWLVRRSVTHDGRYLLVNCAQGSDFSGMDDEVLIVDLEEESWTPRSLVRGEDGGRWRYVHHEGDRFWMKTTVGAPNGRLVRFDVGAAEDGRAGEVEVVVPEEARPLASVSVHPDRFGLGYLTDARTELTFVDRDGEVLGRQLLPGNVSGLPTDRDRFDVVFSISSLYDPGSLVSMDVRTGEIRPVWGPELAHDPAEFELRQVFYRSQDGTRVPMWIAGRRDVLAKREPAPLMMYAYGSLGWAAFPWYQAHLVVWMESGGLYALPGIRGGGEYGDAWWEAGRRRNRPAAIADVTAAAEFLCEAGYTSPAGLIANGGSASGVILGAAAMQRPDLFAAALLEIAKFDLLRHHLFTGSDFASKDLGTSDDVEDFRVLRGYSPVHNVEPGVDYPAILVTVGENDGTCPPLHGMKFIAELQARSTSAQPAMLLYQRDTGHGWGPTPEDRARHQAMALAFLERATNY